MTDSAKFKGFLSYSRKDEEAVRRLHRKLESYEIPKPLRGGGAARLGRFFRDKDELGAASELGAELSENIAAAEWLIVCCSPNSASSHWVGAELDAFIAAHGRERVLAVILDGEPREVFPPGLRTHEPLAADFRKSGDGEELGFLKLVAGLLDADLGELRDRQAAAERARTRNRAILAGAFALLAVGASVSAVVAVQQRERAEAMTAEAIDIGAGVLGEADGLSQRFGVPTSALAELLEFAHQRFDRLFSRDVRSPELVRQRAMVEVQFAELYLRSGDTARARAQAMAALSDFQHLPAGAQRTLDYVRALVVAGRAEEALGHEARAIAYATRAIDAARQAHSADPVEDKIALGAALMRLGEIHMGAERAAQALPLFAEAAPLLESVYNTRPTDVAIANFLASLDWLGGAQAMTGDRAAAQQTFETLVRANRILIEGDPGSLSAHVNLGNALMKLGQTLADAGDAPAARAPLQESVAIARTVLASDPNDTDFQNALALRLVLTAEVLTALGQETPAMMEEAIAMARLQVRADPASMDRKQTLARMLAVRAARLESAGDNAAARNGWREIARLRRAIRAAAPANAPTPAAELAYALEMIGDVSANLRDPEGMLGAYAEAVPLRRTALAAAPQSTAAQAALAGALHALGQTKIIVGDNAGAEQALGEAARIRLALAEAGRDDAVIAFAAVDSLQQLGVAQAASDGAAARRSFESARDILRRLVAAYPNDARYADSLARTEAVLQP